MAILAVGVFLMTMLTTETPTTQIALDLFVFGFGLGLGMQVLTVAVQNVVGVADLGAATSGVAFFRSIGSLLGVAVFGAIYANSLSQAVASAGASPQAYADAIHSVFIFVLIASLTGFGLSWFLQEVPLRSTSTQVDTGETLGVPMDRSSADELARAVSRLVSRQRPIEVYARLVQRANLTLSPGAAWMLAQIRSLTPEERLEARRRWEGRVTPELVQWHAELEAAGYLAQDRTIQLSPQGEEVAQALADARHAAIRELTADWPPGEQAALARLLDRFADSLQGSEPEDQIAREAVATRS
jgi:hypothetical protein